MYPKIRTLIREGVPAELFDREYFVDATSSNGVITLHKGFNCRDRSNSSGETDASGRLNLKTLTKVKDCECIELYTSVKYASNDFRFDDILALHALVKLVKKLEKKPTFAGLSTAYLALEARSGFDGLYEWVRKTRARLDILKDDLEKTHLLESRPSLTRKIIEVEFEQGVSDLGLSDDDLRVLPPAFYYVEGNLSSAWRNAKLRKNATPDTVHTAMASAMYARCPAPEHDMLPLVSPLAYDPKADLRVWVLNSWRAAVKEICVRSADVMEAKVAARVAEVEAEPADFICVFEGEPEPCDLLLPLKEFTVAGGLTGFRAGATVSSFFDECIVEPIKGQGVREVLETASFLNREQFSSLAEALRSALALAVE